MGTCLKAPELCPAWSALIQGTGGHPGSPRGPGVSTLDPLHITGPAFVGSLLQAAWGAATSQSFGQQMIDE